MRDPVHYRETMAALKQPPKHVAVTVSGQEILPAHHQMSLNQK